jgi:hypothetical protein
MNISWTPPKFESGTEEYFENEHTKKYLANKGIKFESPEELISFLRSGKSERLSISELSSGFKNLSLDPEDFKKELSDKEYAKSFKSMEKELNEKGNITLESPILLKLDHEFYCFSGNRRVNLAKKYDIPVSFWVVDLSSRKISVNSFLRNLAERLSRD